MAALVLGGCATAPPEAPRRIQAPRLGVGVIDLSDAEVTGLLLPPPPTPEELGDPILASPAANLAGVRRRVNYWILRWQTWGEGTFTRYLERMQLYVEMVDSAIAERGLPPSLRYLPIVESGYNPGATSRVGAAGMWQFMRPTARFLGMDVNALLDERRDAWRATGFALDYLADINERFDGSWFLTLAAYNGGWGRVQRIIEREGDGAPPSDSLFWALRDHFPSETQDFVPKLLAAARLARNPEAYGFDADSSPGSLWPDAVRVPDATSLDVVARAAGVSVEAVERLNPHLLRGYTPPGRETVVRIPRGSADRFEMAYSSIPVSERVSFIEHRIGRGETLSHLADRYLVPVAEIRAANPRLNPRRIQIGQWVVVPRSPTMDSERGVRVAAVAAAEPAAEATATSSGGPASRGVSAGGTDGIQAGAGDVGDVGEELVYRVSRGESLWLIARRHDVHVADLRRWNDLDEDDILHPGDALRILGVEMAVYTVQAGDTLSDIALTHGVRIDALMRANGMRSTVIRPGDRVQIP